MTDAPVLDCDGVRDLAGLYALGALEPGGGGRRARAPRRPATLGHPSSTRRGGAAAALLETVEPVEPPAGAQGRGSSRPPRRTCARAGTRRRAGASTAAGVVPPRARHDPRPRPRAPGRSLDAERARRRFRWASLAAAAAVIVARGRLGALERLAPHPARGRRGLPPGGRGGPPARRPSPAASTALLAERGRRRVRAGRDRRRRDRAARDARPRARRPGSQVYAAWAIGADGVPVQHRRVHGGGRRDRAATAGSPAPGPADVLALTLEPGAGATTPTMPIVASGTAEPVAG